ncbi:MULTISPECIES: xanthine dehydrogenase family protein molybdopterin-binding subunit [Geobacillus]|uniref:Xanthine dehydrogenase family protein molybdopterin-binding subunit n=4 Tax=Geobacillus TaxID=129337 RepID=A0A7H1RU20_9BACL|nr:MULTISPECIES: xanthine dehydrogenase family protein molybdopterin-binding subunit [Geobacillus]OQP24060.1 aldehyde oxidase [Geobacillus zalihae]QNU17759.1 xanthine dehydrogenase family protein molybdopterin-binding subunit [Geobacillus zalihae]
MAVGKSIIRKEAWDKVTGRAKYTNDFKEQGMLHASLVTSPYAHARILSLEARRALAAPGVHAVVTGEGLPLTGEDMRDRPPIAVDKVRYYGEVVAVVVADTLAQAEQAARLVRVVYEPLPAVGSPREALKEGAPLLHEHLDRYEKNKTTHPEPGTNVAHRTKIRKGNIEQGFAESDVIVETSVSFAPSDHIAMETRCATAEIWPDGTIHISASSQSPFMIKKLLHTYFGEETGKVIVHTPLVGGAYGGKAPVQLELLAYLASKAVGGRKVSVWNSREHDMVTSPVHIGLEATVKIGATKEGLFKAMEILFLFDGGAYSDKAIDVSRAAAVDCTGPYHVENVFCDSLCVYTNRPYATPFRSFGHCEQAFAVERAIDELARTLQLDPWEVRRKNAIRPGHTTPTQVRLTKSNVGNISACLDRLRELMRWDEWQRVEVDAYTVRAKGISSGWKTSTIDTDASSGVILTFNSDGSVNVISGVVEIGTGTKTVLAQIVAERLKMDVDCVHVKMDIDTQTTPEHWKTVASRGTFMDGRAALAAADDAIRQLKDIAACVLRASPDDLEVGFGRVFLRDDPAIFLPIKDIAYGYKFPNGNAIGGQVIGRGRYILRHLTPLDPETGAGKPGPEWGVCAEGVEIEFNRRDYTYRIVKAYAVIDAGKVLNPKAALGQAMGAMSMGLSFSSREGFLFDNEQRVLNPQLRTYRPIRFGEHPEYIVEFVETPQIDAPYGARGIGEHGLIGMPAALANALSLAAGVPLNELPLVPELIWRTQKGDSYGSV